MKYSKRIWKNRMNEELKALYMDLDLVTEVRKTKDTVAGACGVDRRGLSVKRLIFDTPDSISVGRPEIMSGRDGV